MQGRSHKGAAPSRVRMTSGRDQWPMPQHSRQDFEHRLTVVEITNDHQDTRLNELERKQLQPRDLMMIGAGIAAIAAAALGKIDWKTALTLLLKS